MIDFWCLCAGSCFKCNAPQEGRQGWREDGWGRCLDCDGWMHSTLYIFSLLVIIRKYSIFCSWLQKAIISLIFSLSQIITPTVSAVLQTRKPYNAENSNLRLLAKRRGSDRNRRFCERSRSLKTWGECWGKRRVQIWYYRGRLMIVKQVDRERLNNELFAQQMQGVIVDDEENWC